VRRGLLASLALFPACAPDASAVTNLFFGASVTVRETYDSNLYLQYQEPLPTVPGAVRPFQDSLVTSVTPKVALDWKPLPEFNLNVTYSPDLVWYHAEPSEDHQAHKGAVIFSGKVRETVWEQFNTINYIDGSREGLTFGGPNGAADAPAIGGIPIRDRRAALIYRNGFRAHHPRGNWFFRPVAASYVHDFFTEQRTTFGYQNYVDRNDFNAGIDFGLRLYDQVFLVAGYRYGFQNEPPLPGRDVDYSNDYHRGLAGIEGRLTSWLKVNLLMGPGYHDFRNTTDPGFDRHLLVLYVDGSAVITPTTKDTITLTMKQFAQPAFGAPSMYEDITYQISVNRKFSDHWSATAGFRAYNGDWFHPVTRNDWIFTPSAGLQYTVDRQLNASLGYSYDWADSLDPDRPFREFTRHQAWLTVQYQF
jgi:hypothetical protein